MSDARRITPRIWIAWETQRRSITLSRMVGATLVIMDWEKQGLLRYPLSLLATARLLIANRRNVVFVQNPSMVLAFFASVLKPILGYTLVVDRHSNFFFGGEKIGRMAKALLSWMSRVTIRLADITIVTNTELVKSYIEGRGHGFVLPDPYPAVPEQSELSKHNSDSFDIFFVSTWQTDEPIREVIEACRILGPSVRVHISGRVRKSFEQLLADKPDNFIPTGFLSDEDYFRAMGSADAVMAISTRPATLCCGAYEGIAMGKPMILGDSSATREYFTSGAVYTNSTVSDLVEKIRYLVAHRDALEHDVSSFYSESSVAWTARLTALDRMIEHSRTR